MVKLVEGLDHPWSLAFLPDGRMLVTERPGRLNLIGRDFKRSHIEGVPRVYASGQGGLGGASTELARARLNGARLEDLRVLLRGGAEDRGRPALRAAAW